MRNTQGKFLYDRRDRCRSRLGMRNTPANSSMTDEIDADLV
jgi:hypothetical protein